MALPYRYLKDHDQVKLAFLECYRPLDEVKLFCQSFCDYYAYILHDKDTKEDGTLKTPHVHVLCHFNERPRFSSVKNTLANNDTKDTTVLGQTVMSKHLAFQYLTHSNDKSKYQYPLDEVVCNDYSFFQSSTQVELEAKNDEFLDNLLTLKPLEMARIYGRDYMKNFKQYNDFRNMLLNEIEREAEIQEAHDLGIEYDENVFCIPSYPNDNRYNYEYN